MPSLAPSSHWEFSMNIRKLNVMRAPDMASIFGIWGLTLNFLWKPLKLGQSMTINYYDPMNIFHINKIKVLQDNWQNICLSRLSIHQGDAFIYILRTLDNRYYEPDWSDCSDPNDPEKCVVYTWWKKKCKGKSSKFSSKIQFQNFGHFWSTV